MFVPFRPHCAGSIPQKRHLPQSKSAVKRIEPFFSIREPVRTLCTNNMFAGLQKTTLINFPRRVAAAVFLPGCNMRCPYCHNAELAAAPANGPINGSIVSGSNNYYSLDEIYAFLHKRKNLISGLVISGGEPCMSPALIGLITEAKKLHLQVKIDTNGFFPEKLTEILGSAELRPDMIAIDIKTSLDRYIELFPAMQEKHFAKLKKAFLQTLNILKNEDTTLETEYRTVLAPGLVTKTEIKEIAALLPENARWRLAPFVPGNCLNAAWNLIKPYTETQTVRLERLAAELVKDTALR